MSHDVASLTTVRLRLKELGYDPIPLKTDKKPYTDWPREPNGPEDIALWGRYLECVATGIRMFKSPDLFVLDLDIRIPAVRDAILEAYAQRWPQFMANCVRRHSQGVTLALIGRSKANRGSLRSRRWRVKDCDPAEKDHLIEVFTRHSKRFVVVDGAHSPGRAYGYQGPPLWEIAPDKLPEFPFDDVAAALTIADDIMRAAGLVQKQKAILGSTSSMT